MIELQRLESEKDLEQELEPEQKQDLELGQEQKLKIEKIKTQNKTMVTNMLDKFQSVTMMHIPDFDPEMYFKQQPWYEVYNPEKTYEMYFNEDFGEGLKTYWYRCLQINDVYYIIPEEVISDEELALLMPFCPCRVCESYWLDLRWLFMCRCCVGCLKAVITTPSMDHVRIARKRRDLLVQP